MTLDIRVTGVLAARPRGRRAAPGLRHLRGLPPLPAALPLVQGHVRPPGRGRGGRRRREAPRRRRQGSRRSLLPVQALLQPLPLHAAAPVGGGLPAPHAARALRGGARQGRDPAGPLPRQHRAGRAHRQPHRARLELDERGVGSIASSWRRRSGSTPGATCRPSTARRSRAGSTGGSRGRAAAPARDRVALFTTCSVEYNDPGTGQGRGGGAREERGGRDAARPAVLRDAVPRRGRGHRGQAAHRGERQEPRRAGPARAGDRGAGADVLLHAQAGVSVARRLGRRQPGRGAHPRPLRVPGRAARRRGASTSRSRTRPAPSPTSCPAT